MSVRSLPIVVTTVVEKKIDCPKVQFGPVLRLLDAETPRLLARTTSLKRNSKSSSETNYNLRFSCFCTIYNILLLIIMYKNGNILPQPLSTLPKINKQTVDIIKNACMVDISFM